MATEDAIIERVETFVRHPAFAGSDGLMAEVLDDLRAKAEARVIGEATHRRLRELILRSPHFGMN